MHIFENNTLEDLGKKCREKAVRIMRVKDCVDSIAYADAEEL